MKLKKTQNSCGVLRTFAKLIRIKGAIEADPGVQITLVGKLMRPRGKPAPCRILRYASVIDQTSMNVNESLFYSLPYAFWEIHVHMNV